MTSIDYFERRLDSKRRLSIPVEIRSEFDDGYVITRGFNKYLHLYSKKIWNEIVEPNLEGSILDEKIADLNVKLRIGKSQGSIDSKQGRLCIEQHLLDYASIDREIVAVRAGKYWRILPK